LTDCVLAGGDPVACLCREFARLNWPWPQGVPTAHRINGPLGSAGLAARMATRGLRLDGQIVHPHLNLTVTGRITYSQPAPQTFEAADRLARITPIVSGRMFLRADYGQIEPRILVSILSRLGLIRWEVGPDEDLYRVLAGDGADREVAKVAVNKGINGGRAEPGATGRLAEFIAATEAYRVRLASSARAAGYVETLSGRKVPLSRNETNHPGKSVNRVVQSTAADIFNRASAGVLRAIESEGLPAAVNFLLYDEIWVECDPEIATQIEALVRVEMGAAAEMDGLKIPVRFDK